jgi:hypothetical protein
MCSCVATLPPAIRYAFLGNDYLERGDYQNALAYYQESAQLGFYGGQYNLGLMYYNGYGVRKNYTTALNWYYYAASQGYPPAQYNLGLMYCKGEGTAFDLNSCLHWLNLSASNGDMKAAQVVQEINNIIAYQRQKRAYEQTTQNINSLNNFPPPSPTISKDNNVNNYHSKDDPAYHDAPQKRKSQPTLSPPADVPDKL